MFRRISCLVLLSLLACLLWCGPALAADNGGGSGHTLGYVSIAIVVLIAVMGFVNSSKTLMKNVKPKARMWLRRVHGFLGVVVIVTIVIHILTVSD